MIVSAYQPYFAPFPGFFSKAFRSDTLVLMDVVQFPRGTTWLSRNRFKNDQGTLWLTVPVWKKGLGLQKINEVRVCPDGRWLRKSIFSLRHAYANAPYFEDHRFFLEDVLSVPPGRLIDLNLRIIQYIVDYLQIPVRIELLSDLGIRTKEPRLSVEICRQLGATHFLAQRGAGKYLDRVLFDEAGIKLVLFNFRPPVYPQLWGPFVPNLSVFDMLFNCGPATRNILEMTAFGEKGVSR